MKLILALVFASSFAFAADVADKLTFTVSNNAIVLPNSLSDIQGQTCVSGGVKGPRVRMRASVKWEGEGVFVPHTIRTSFNHYSLESHYAGVVSSGVANAESLAFMFGLSTDYIPSGSFVYVTTSCFVDFGGLPYTTLELNEKNEIVVPAKVAIAGVIRGIDGNETPIKKEISSTIIYVAGSIPAL